jgi:hypothetical protein
MDDGSFTGSGLKLHTNAFSFKELNLLIEALNKNFSIKATINISPLLRGAVKNKNATSPKGRRIFVFFTPLASCSYFY